MIRLVRHLVTRLAGHLSGRVRRLEYIVIRLVHHLVTRLAGHLSGRARWRPREVKVVRHDGPPTMQVVDHVAWRWLVSGAVYVVCSALGHPCKRSSPVGKLVGWARAVEDGGRNVLVSTPITTKQATALFPHVTERHDDLHDDSAKDSGQDTDEGTGAGAPDDAEEGVHHGQQSATAAAQTTAGDPTG